MRNKMKNKSKLTSFVTVDQYRWSSYRWRLAA